MKKSQLKIELYNKNYKELAKNNGNLKKLNDD